MINSKKCSKCNKTKKLVDFPIFYKNGKQYHRGECKSCYNKRKQSEYSKVSGDQNFKKKRNVRMKKTQKPQYAFEEYEQHVSLHNVIRAGAGNSITYLLKVVDKIQDDGFS